LFIVHSRAMIVPYRANSRARLWRDLCSTTPSSSNEFLMPNALTCRRAEYLETSATITGEKSKDLEWCKVLSLDDRCSISPVQNRSSHTLRLSVNPQ
jgi:hypothetical protein